MTVPSALTQVILGMGVPRDWQMTSAPVVLEKSTWLGGSWIKTGPLVGSPPWAIDDPAKAEAKRTKANKGQQGCTIRGVASMFGRSNARERFLTSVDDVKIKLSSRQASFG